MCEALNVPKAGDETDKAPILINQFSAEERRGIASRMQMKSQSWRKRKEEDRNLEMKKEVEVFIAAYERVARQLEEKNCKRMVSQIYKKEEQVYERHINEFCF